MNIKAFKELKIPDNEVTIKEYPVMIGNHVITIREDNRMPLGSFLFVSKEDIKAPEE